MRAVAAVTAVFLVACSATGGEGTSSTATTFGPPPASASGPDTSGAAPTSPPPLIPGSVGITEIATGFDRPVDLVWLDGVAHVVEQRGLVVPLRDGRPGDPVLDVRSLVSTGGEQGLLAVESVANTAFVNYTDVDGATVVAALGIGSDGTIDPDSARILLTIEQPYANHNGGDLVLGPDGMLYIATGDGGSAGDPLRSSLDTSSLLGKILRVDPRIGSGRPYTIPDDNPFVGASGARPEIWSIGLRNPWRIDIDPTTGDLWIPDVGQNVWEEVNLAPADGGAVGGRGANFGWSAFEARQRFNDDQDPSAAMEPVFDYEHGDAGCSVSGGAVYRGSAIPTLVGWFVFGDFCSGRLVAIRVGTAGTEEVALGEAGSVSAVRRGPDGEVYVLDHTGGRILRLTSA